MTGHGHVAPRALSLLGGAALLLGAAPVRAAAAAAPATAASPAAPAPPGPKAALLAPPSLAPDPLAAEIPLRVSPRTRVSQEAAAPANVLRLLLHDDDEPVAAQLQALGLPALRSFVVRSDALGGLHVDLRLDPGVRGIAVRREAPDRLTIRLASTPIADGPAPAPAAEPAGGPGDPLLESILSETLKIPPNSVRTGPFLWAVGTASPLRPIPSFEPRPLPFGALPDSLRQRWEAAPPLRDALAMADGGAPEEAAARLQSLSPGDDEARALLAAARGLVWSKRLPDGRPADAGRCADAFVTAAGLQAQADWVPWARGQAGWCLVQARRPEDAVVQFARAAAAAPDAAQEPWWQLGRGSALLVLGRPAEALPALVRAASTLPGHDPALRFESRRALVHALWASGDAARAARVLDLAVDEHPELARQASLLAAFARVYLDAGAAEGAHDMAEAILEAEPPLPEFERARARFWLHEAGLVSGDQNEARRRLAELRREHPRSTLSPLAELRLFALDALEANFLGNSGISAVGGKPPVSETVSEASPSEGGGASAGGGRGPASGGHGGGGSGGGAAAAPGAPGAPVRVQTLRPRALPGGRPAVALRLREIAAAWPATPVEDEALSLAAQLLASMDMLEDALAVYRRVQDRTPSEGGAVAYARFVCEVAPRAFDELRSRGQLLRALGVYRGYLEKPEAHACVDPRMRMDAASTAVAAGLPMLAQRWVGQAVVTGTGTREDSENVLVLASLYRREGRLDLAERTLDWLEDGEMPLPEPELLAERGSVAMLRGEAAEAERAYRLAMERAATTVRGRAALPGLRWRRALALEKLGAGRGREALAELRGALAEGGAAAEDGGGGEGAGWERAAALGAQLASDAASWEAVLADVGRAEEARGEERPRSLRWRRAEALFALGRRVEAEPILDELAATPDAWGLLARSARARADFEARLDEVVAERERD